MVNFAIREALRMGKYSIRKLHEVCYPHFKQKYNYSTYYYSRAYRIASQIIRSYRRRDKEPRVKKLFVRLHKAQFKLEADKLKVSIKPREFAVLKFELGEYQRKVIWKNLAGELKVGEITVNENHVYIPFIEEVDVTEGSGKIALDLNENEVVGVTDKGEVKRWSCSYIGKTREKYEAIRAKIQQNVANHTRKFKRLMAKYGAREANKVKDFAVKLVGKELEVNDVKVNVGDNFRKGIFYLTVTGTSAEQGDDGNAGRGNRINGLITPCRQMSLEATAGKNPVSHVGKIYNLLAKITAEKVCNEVKGIREVYVKILSSIGKPITEPQIVSIHVNLEKGYSLRNIAADIKSIVYEETANVQKLTSQIIE
mgnify:CR=1 FL=1